MIIERHALRYFVHSPSQFELLSIAFDADAIQHDGARVFIEFNGVCWQIRYTAETPLLDTGMVVDSRDEAFDLIWSQACSGAA